MSKELLTLALEALESAQGYIEAEHDDRKSLYEPYGMDYKYSTEAEDLYRNKEAITALRQALEQPPADEPVAFKTLSKIGKAVGYWRADLMPRHITLDSHDITPLYTRPQPAVSDERTNDESVAKDAEEWGNALNSASWAAVDAWDKDLMGPMSGAVFNNIKGVVRAAILAYLKETRPAERKFEETSHQSAAWVGLTDEERDDLLDTYISAEGRARAIEAKLKEKNT